MSDMFNRFDNMPDIYVPNNMHLPIQSDNTDEIVRGADIKHTVIIPYKYSDMINSSTIYYYNKLHTVLEKNDSEFEIVDNEYSSIISIHLNPEETILFEKNWDTYYQLKLELVDGSTVFTDKCFIKVLDTLEDKQ